MSGFAQRIIPYVQIGGYSVYIGSVFKFSDGYLLTKNPDVRNKKSLIKLSYYQSKNRHKKE